MDASLAGILGALFFAVAALYAAVGHAGASGYLAAMALLGVPDPIMKSTALALNVLVATITTIRFHRTGQFRWNVFWPFTVGAVPLAFIGGATHLPAGAYRSLVGVLLLLSAGLLLRGPAAHHEVPARPLPPLVGVLCGAAIGLLAGLTGTGGGIFLSPLLLSAGWSNMRETAGIAAAFILANSLAGLAGNVAALRALPTALPLWLAAAGAGGALGATLGSRRLSPDVLRQLLAAVLAVGALKLLLTS